MQWRWLSQTCCQPTLASSPAIPGKYRAVRSVGNPLSAQRYPPSLPGHRCPGTRQSPTRDLAPCCRGKQGCLFSKPLAVDASGSSLKLRTPQISATCYSGSRLPYCTCGFIAWNVVASEAGSCNPACAANWARTSRHLASSARRICSFLTRGSDRLTNAEK